MTIAVRCALIGAAAVILAALISALHTSMKNQKNDSSEINQVVSGQGLGVVNTGKGDVKIKSEESILNNNDGGGMLKAAYIGAIAVVVAALIPLIFSLFRKAELGVNKINQAVSEKGVAVVNTGDGNVSVGISLAEYETGLKQREKEVVEQMKVAHSQENKLLKIEKEQLEIKLRKIGDSHAEYIAGLKDQIEQLESIRFKAPHERLNAVQAALSEGDLKLADQHLAEIEQESADLLKVAGEAAFQRAKIAVTEVQYLPAKIHFTRALQYSPDNITYLFELGLLENILGSYQDAIEHLNHALTISIERHGGNHPQVAQIYNSLAMSKKALGDFKVAVPYYEKALGIYISCFGGNSIHVAGCQNNLGQLWRDLGDNEKARGYCEQALAGSLRLLPESHPQVAVCRNNLGLVWKNMGKYKKAIQYFELAFKSDVETYGDKHPVVASRLNNLGTAWAALGVRGKAREFYQQALSIYVKVYGKNHPESAVTENNLGLSWLEFNESDKALDCFKRALNIDLIVFGEIHHRIAIRHNNIGLAWRSKGEHEAAMRSFKLALDVGRSSFGERHFQIATYYNNVGISWHSLGEYQNAIIYLEKALGIFVEQLGENHPGIISVKHNLKEAQDELLKEGA